MSAQLQALPGKGSRSNVLRPSVPCSPARGVRTLYSEDATAAGRRTVYTKDFTAAGKRMVYTEDNSAARRKEEATTAGRRTLYTEGAPATEKRTKYYWRRPPLRGGGPCTPGRPPLERGGPCTPKRPPLQGGGPYTPRRPACLPGPQVHIVFANPTKPISSRLYLPVTCLPRGRCY